MMKISAILAALGLALLLASALPGQAAPPAGVSTAAPTTSAPAQAEVAYGQALFSAKGCVTCHHHAAVAGSGALGEGNPDLSTYRWNADYLRKWLQNPSAVKPGTYMPTLGLKQDEIEALIAFLSSGTKP
ncbi:MAG TPA: c-type cytochrome [Roseiflexaceae bacterium]